MFIACAMTALLSDCFPTFKSTDFLQDGEAAGRTMATVFKTTTAIAAGRNHAIRAGTSLDLSKGNLQTGQWVVFVHVLFLALVLMLQQS